MSSFKASSSASGGDRIQGWKLCWSVQLSFYVLMVLSLRLHEAKLPVLGIPAGQSKSGAANSFLPNLLDGTHPPGRLPDSPAPVEQHSDLQFAAPSSRVPLPGVPAPQIPAAVQVGCRHFSTSNLTVPPLLQPLLLTKGLPVRLGRNSCLKNCISGFTQRFLLIVWNNTSFIIQSARQSHSSSLDDTFYLQTPRLTHKQPVNPSGSFYHARGMFSWLTSSTVLGAGGIPCSHEDFFRVFLSRHCAPSDWSRLFLWS